MTNYETVIQNKEGRRIPVKLNTDLLWDDAGNLAGVVEVYRDVSLLKELQDKLARESSQGDQGRLIVKSKALQSILNLLPQVENILEQAFIRCLDHTIRLEHLPEYLVAEKGPPLATSSEPRQIEQPKLLSMERQAIQETLDKAGWNYPETCRILGISRSTLLRRIKAFGLTRTDRSN